MGVGGERDFADREERRKKEGVPGPFGAAAAGGWRVEGVLRG